MRLPLPFPSCPSCARSWIRCHHSGCPSDSDIDIETDTRTAQCSACFANWHVELTQFVCSCGRRFSATEVAAAISNATLLRDRLRRQIEAMDASELAITQRSRESRESWLASALERLAISAGYRLGRAVRYVRQL